MSEERPMIDPTGTVFEPESPKTSPVVSPMRQPRSMNFVDSLNFLLDGHKLRRKEWADDGTYIVIREEKLMIYTPGDKQIHPLTVSTGDIMGNDWVVYNPMIKSAS